VLKRQEYVERVLHNGQLCDLLSAETREFVSALATIISSGSEEQQKRAVQRLLSQFGESWRSFWLQAHEMRQGGELDLKVLFDGCIKSAQRVQFTQQVKALEADLQSATDEQERARIAQNLLDLQRRGATPPSAR
jgi:hypothetical protein